MKKIIIVFSLIFLTASYIQAQIVKSIELKSGVVWANQDWEYENFNIDLQTEFKTGFHIAMIAELFQHEYISMLNEVGYTQKGFKIELEVTNAGSPEPSGEFITKHYTYGYIYYSPQLKFRKEFRNIIPFIYLGPRIEYQVEQPSEFSNQNWTDFYTDIILGISYGFGVEYRFNRFGAGMIFQHQYDMSDCYNRSPTDENAVGLETKNKAFLLDLGIKYYFMQAKE